MDLIEFCFEIVLVLTKFAIFLINRDLHMYSNFIITAKVFFTKANPRAILLKNEEKKNNRFRNCIRVEFHKKKKILFKLKTQM